MKNKVWIIVAVAFLAIMISAAVLYPKLADEFTDREFNVVDSDGGEVNTESVNQTEDFTVYDANMQPIKLSNSFGKPIVINFWATWCGPCRSELSAFDAMYKKYGEDVVFMMINLTDGHSDTVSGVKQFVAENGFAFPVYYDVEYDASNTYGVYSIPETVFITADGSLYDIRIGAMSEVALENYIKQLIGG